MRALTREDQDRVYTANQQFVALLGELEIPIDWVSVPGVGHKTGQLYQRFCLESLTFITHAFADTGEP